MSKTEAKGSAPSFDFKDAARFWEPLRLWYNGLLLLLVVLWMLLTWPHFRSAINLVALGEMVVLALLANLCYCAGYVAEAFIQPLAGQGYRGRIRWTVWIVGVLFSLLLANYWIADEIYPDVSQVGNGAFATRADGLGKVIYLETLPSLDAQSFLYFSGDRCCQSLHLCFGFGLDHDASERFCA